IAGPGTTVARTGPRVEVRTAALVRTAGTAVGVRTGLVGVGGGGVIGPALALALKLPMPQAIGTSLLVIAINSAVALSARIATTSIEWNVTVPFTVAAIAGVLTGGRIADRLDPEGSLRWFAALLVAVAAYTALRAGAALMG
ncbi:MAG: TSUP family transporter, partial [Microthrixaceae bacterium]